MTKLLVAGSTGTIGRSLMRALSAHPELEVRVGVRSPARAAPDTRAVRLD